MSRGETLPVGWLHEPQLISNQPVAGGVGVSTPCEEVTTRGISVLVAGLSEL